MALFETNTTLIEKFKFRGICFLLTLRWLELRGSKNNANSIFALKDNTQFGKLWGEFKFHSNEASKLKSILTDEIESFQLDLDSYNLSLRTTKDFLNSLQTHEVDSHIMGIDKLRRLQSAKKLLVQKRDKAREQFQRMFVDDNEALFDVGTPSEQIMRKLMQVTIKMTITVDIEVVSEGSFFSKVVKKWADAGTTVEKFVKSLSVNDKNAFEIGLYGSGAHSVGAFSSKDGADISFFDPNYGVYESDGKLRKFGDDVANLLEDCYPKMTKVVVTYLV